jgi:hypothetical protein
VRDVSHKTRSLSRWKFLNTSQQNKPRGRWNWSYIGMVLHLTFRFCILSRDSPAYIPRWKKKSYLRTSVSYCLALIGQQAWYFLGHSVLLCGLHRWVLSRHDLLLVVSGECCKRELQKWCQLILYEEFKITSQVSTTNWCWDSTMRFVQGSIGYHK